MLLFHFWIDTIICNVVMQKYLNRKNVCLSIVTLLLIFMEAHNISAAAENIDHNLIEGVSLISET
jgi:hypothetical protein